LKILRGKAAGRPAKPHQFANDWIQVDFTDEAGGHAIVSPRNVQLDTAEERAMFLDTNPIHAGQFWAEWALNDDGTFRSLHPRRRAAQ
jgi:hypothetical protein